LIVASEAQSEGSGLAFHPMDQFIVQPLFAGNEVHWYTITNVTLWMALTVVAVLAIMVFGTSHRGIIPSRSQSIGELVYGFIYKMVEDVAGKDAVGYFPYIMTLFMFILCANFLGLLPMSFTTTSHIAVTAVMAMAVFLAVTIIGFAKNGAFFLVAVLDFFGAFTTAADFGFDRSHFLLCTPRKSFDQAGW
jgi:F-type H+-transporting ATPase subunit a